MARARRWPEEAEQERQDAISFFNDIEALAEKLEYYARRDPVQVEKIGLKILLAVANGRHTLEMAKPTKNPKGD
jgi:hypothetical protein